MKEYKRRFGVDSLVEMAEDLAGLGDLGLIESADDHHRLTRRGTVYSNEVFALFV